MPTEPKAPYISTIEAAKRHHLTHDHVGLLCRKGRVQGMLLGRQWFVNEQSLLEYLKKSVMQKEARRAALSKQWRAAWTAAFIGLSFFTAHPPHAAADLISMPARIAVVKEPAIISISSVVAKVGEMQEHITVQPLLTAQAVQNKTAAPLTQPQATFFSDVKTGFLVVGEAIVNIFTPAYPHTLRVVYAKDFERPSPVEGLPREPISMFFTAAAINAGAVAATLPVPEVTYELPKTEPVLTAENLLLGTMLANETLRGLNEEMFALYAKSFSSFAHIVAFDIEAGAHVWGKTFGAFGERFVNDLAYLNELQVGFYIAAANSLEDSYNSFADAIEGSQVLDSSISVASVNFAPSFTMPGQEQLASVWDGWVGFLADTFFAPRSSHIKTAPQAPAQKAEAVSSVKQKPAAAVALKPSAPIAQNTPVTVVAPPASASPPQSSSAPALAQPALFAGNFVTQSSLNTQFNAWMQVVLSLIEKGKTTGYVDNPAAAAIGSGGGTSVVNNYFAAAQRIDKLDRVTITNSSINGVSDFSSLGSGFPATSTISIAYGGTGISTYPTYGQVLLGNSSGGYDLVATSSLGISGGGVADGVGSWFVPTSYGNSTSTIIGFTGGLLVTGSTTLNGNSTTTGNAYFASTLQIGKSSGQVQIKNDNSASQLDIDFPDLSTAAGSVRLFRNTSTTGNRLFSIYKGDGSNTTVFQVNATSGALTINGQDGDDNLIRLRGTGVGQRATMLWQNAAGTQTFGTISAHDENDPAHLPTNHISIETTMADLTTTRTRLGVLWGVDQSEVQISNANLILDSNEIRQIGNTTSSMSSTTWQLVGANGTASSTLLVSNTTNSAVDAPAIIEARVGGNTTTGDPQLRLSIANGNTWHVGVDNSNNDLFEIGTSTAVGGSGNGVLTVSTSGVVTAVYNGGSLAVGDGSNSSAYMNVAGGRTMFGYNGANAVVQGGTSKGIIFNVNNSSFGSGTAAIITSAGLVGIGTTSPWGLLSVNPSGISGPAFVVGSSTATHFIVTNTGTVGIGTSSPSRLLSVHGNSYLAGGLYVADSQGTYQVGGNGTAMVIDFSGAASDYGLIMRSKNGGTTPGVAFYDNATNVGSITWTNSATTYNTSSDRRVKEGITDTTLALDTLLQLPVREFSFKSDTTHATTTGFIAQELYEVFPWAVTTNGDNGIDPLTGSSTPWAVDYGRITPLIVKAVQDIANIASSFKQNLIAWLADAANGITKLFAKEVHTEKLCVGNTCVTEEQFLALVAGGSSSPASTPTPAPEPQTEPSASSTQPILEVNEPASSTPQVPEVEEEPTPPLDEEAVLSSLTEE